jgi:ribosomal protein S18 acetylase RimI-like enzyme
MEEITIQRAHKKHASILAEYRYRMFDEMYPDENLNVKKDEIINKSKKYYLSHIDAADHYSVIACLPDKIVGCGTLLLQEKPPNPRYKKNLTGYILNIYVDTDYRRRGVAKKIMQHFHDYLQHLEVTRVALHASQFGYGLYTKIGYKPSASYLEKDI